MTIRCFIVFIYFYKDHPLMVKIIKLDKKLLNDKKFTKKLWMNSINNKNRRCCRKLKNNANTIGNQINVQILMRERYNKENSIFFNKNEK